MNLNPKEARRLHVLTLVESQRITPALRAQRCGAGPGGGHSCWSIRRTCSYSLPFAASRRNASRIGGR
jgi:hypothetical protein